jgi:hypothetical protein
MSSVTSYAVFYKNTLLIMANLAILSFGTITTLKQEPIR